MRLALPLGLLGLIAILALVLIYILKPKYQDKKVSSTYVWKLSLRYQKRKVPLQWLKNSLLLIIQLLILALIALMMAQPQVVLATKTGEKIVILDASASMQTVKDSKSQSRFDRAKNEIAKLAESTTAEGDKFSVILAAEETSFVIRRSDSASYIKQKISEAECTFEECDVSAAMKFAEGVLAENPNADVYLYTDCAYEKPGKVTVVNMADSEWNAAILGFSSKRTKGNYVFTAEIASYGRAAEIAVNLNIDGKAKLPRLAQCEENGKTTVVWDNLEIGDYSVADVHISVDDGFAYDNDFYIFGSTSERSQVQLVGTGNSDFLRWSLSAVGCQVKFVDISKPDEYGEPATSGYDLYVYDGAYPEVMPTDGAIMLVTPPENLPSEWGITISGKRNGEFTLSSSASGGSSEAYKKIMNGITPASIYATEYLRITSYPGYESIMQCGFDPVLLVKDEGVKTIVLAMDVHMSDIAMLIEFPLLMNNLCKYAMPSTVESTCFTVGETVTVNAKINTELLEISAKYSAGEETQQSYTEFPVVLEADAAGLFTITQSLSTGRTVTSQYFVRISEKESVFYQTEKTLVNPVVMNSAGTDSTVQNDTMDICVYLAAALLVFVCLEWGLQYREQY